MEMSFHSLILSALGFIKIGREFWGQRFLSQQLRSTEMNISPTNISGGATSPRKGPPKFKQRATRQFKSKPPKAGVKGFGDDIPGMEGLGTDITVICPWEAFSHLELHELAQYGIV
ncbi:retinal cone rhodopsin-sensitive cGMP 3',5'-cyclic phosphodiesterase subunit gamma-like isoform X1 [Stegostoma tigrinum]|uniref:retinal cone rhodopsin-sensitive cGMP 3',5'-cyclic phosphodiesterase subunit gamma-like isoform X1 n=2 Tax=Orectolobiformes TaxID=30503 RepID=UPI00202B5A63|nr:retinal cone rhodopsin-sensitive cGMP 3',5'-cyclic phosphodiesterase subunit gamma-like isoform X1 [Stegostoma tigrinum]XP_059500251.1 retinal cone rhodopsin-sensitive cGMP 3',5'-cyclic phosphodiesterase subunit gamma-like isoform X1 [Stegostoma tigrinum]XP_059500398.1 retinal cone rhodopsin-sensitive cGMP 3',5'-cyclic phosphodiesterase subunit gamma-like isoform X1 [Stegostoma tigrinum]